MVRTTEEMTKEAASRIQSKGAQPLQSGGQQESVSNTVGARQQWIHKVVVRRSAPALMLSGCDSFSR